MRTTRKIRVVWLAIGLLLVLPGSVSGQSESPDEQAAAVVIIGHNSLPEQALTKMDVQDIFLGKKTKLDGTKITFVILKNGEVHEIFLKEYLSRTPSQYTQYWKKMIFTGKGKAPKAFETEEALVEYIQTTEGTIGYIGAATAQGLESGSVHHVIVQ